MGAGVAEMTRVLGTEPVPASLTITTEVCVEYTAEPGSVSDEALNLLGSWRPRPTRIR